MGHLQMFEKDNDSVKQKLTSAFLNVDNIAARIRDAIVLQEQQSTDVDPFAALDNNEPGTTTTTMPSYAEVRMKVAISPVAKKNVALIDTAMAVAARFLSYSHFGLTHPAFMINGLVLDWTTCEFVLPRDVGSSNVVIAADLLVKTNSTVLESLNLPMSELDDFTKNVCNICSLSYVFPDCKADCHLQCAL